MRRLLIACLLFLLTCTGCTARSAAEDAAEQFLQKLSAGSTEAAERLTLSGSFGLQRGGRVAALVTPLFRSLEYVVGRGTAGDDGARATVNVTLTVYSMEEILLSTSVQAFAGLLATGSSDSDDDFYALVLAALESGDASRVSLNTNLAMVRDQGHWKVDLQNSPGLLAAMGGGLSGIITA